MAWSVNIHITAKLSASKDSSLVIRDDVYFGPGCHVQASSGTSVFIAKGVTMHSFVTISGSVSIGEGCLISPRVTILATTHNIDGRGRIRDLDADFMVNNGRPKGKPIVIGSDCWLGVNACIVDGFVLGKGCVVGANSVVTKSFPSYSIVAGAPARVIGMR